MDTGSSRVLVVPRAGGGWQLRETPDGPVLGAASTKREMVARAHLMLEQGRGGQVLVLAADGSVQQTFTVEPAGPRPWWYVRPGFLRWVIPLFFVTQVARFALGSMTSPLNVALGVVGCVGLVVVAVAVWRSTVMDRSRGPRDVGPG